MRPLDIVFLVGPLTDGVPLLRLLRAQRELLHSLRGDVSPKGLPAFLSGEIQWTQFIKELPEGTHTVCIPALISPEILQALSGDDLRGCFPGARLKAFVSFPRQDKELEARFTWASLRGWIPDVKTWLDGELSQKCYDYAEIFSHLECVFGRDNICATIRGEGPDAEQWTQDAFWNFAGITIPQDSATGLRYLTPPLNLSPGRDFCECIRQSLRLYPTLPDEDAPWLKATLALPQQDMHILPPKKRREMLAHWEPSNRRLAAMLGCDTLFDYPTQEDLRMQSEWREYSGLTPESAFAVITRLEKDFAKELLVRFDAMPVHNLTYPQRSIHQALKKTAGVPSIQVTAPEPKLSVVTLTYNHAPFIRDCMDSVIAQQTNFPIQHIIADDCSDDGAQAIILEYAAKYPHIVPVFQTKRSGGHNNVRSMFEMARTEYVALCDGDDYFSDPLKLQRQADFLDAHQECGLCFHVARVTYEDAPGKERFYPEPGMLPRGVRPIYTLVDLLRHNFMQSNTAVYRWRFRNGLPDWFHDKLSPADWYWHLLHAEIGPIGFINNVMSVYRRHKNSSYYQAEVDPLRHRYRKGMRELVTYDVINRHFNRKYQSILFDMANGVFVDWLMASETLGIDTQPLMEEAAERFPDFSRNFLHSLSL